jgi:hypothetical protein
MALKNSNSQTEILEISRIALQNVETNPIIKPLMEALGYNTAKIDAGKALLNEAKTQFNTNKSLEDARANAYKDFEDLKTAIEAKYSKDRKKAKIIYKQDALVLKELGIKGIIPKSYVKWLETVNLFYNLLNTDAAILAKLAPLQVTQEHVTALIADLNTLEDLRAAYIQAKGNAQNATKTKNKAFKDLEKWMSDFYAVARLALEDEPQLLESLGKLVKS